MTPGKTVLARIKRQFSRNREYPIQESLKKLAIFGLDAGLSPKEIANAAGVSSQSIVNWRKQLQPAPVELNVVESAPTPARQPEIVRIHFRSGIIVELPASRLDTELLISLAKGAV
jgi:hypothetical protein